MTHSSRPRELVAAVNTATSGSAIANCAGLDDAGPGSRSVTLPTGPAPLDRRARKVRPDKGALHSSSPC